MEPSQTTDQSFVIRIWLEETAVEAGKATWRGQVTHINSSKQLYIEDLDAIKQFILPYLREMGVKVEP